MAGDVHFDTTDPKKSAMDYAEHERTYAMFLGLTKWIVVSVVIILILMAFFLTGPDTPHTPGAH